jgi:hypothetical protein
MTEFGKNSFQKDGWHYYCKSCNCQQTKLYQKKHEKYRKEYQKKYRESHKELAKKQNKIYHKTHKEEIARRKKIWRKSHKEQEIKCIKIYRQTHRKQLKEYEKIRYQNHKEKIKIYKNNRRKIDVNFKLLSYLRTRIWHALKNNNKSKRSMELIGCSINKLKHHLENQFKLGMSWDNYGKWHIDHIKPCASFDLTKPSEQRKCFHYTNLQPLWAEENLKKSASYDR